MSVADVIARALKREYRIVVDGYAGYEVQTRIWWWPFWQMAGGTNTHYTIEQARRYAFGHEAREVERWKVE